MSPSQAFFNILDDFKMLARKVRDTNNEFCANSIWNRTRTTNLALLRYHVVAQILDLHPNLAIARTLRVQPKICLFPYLAHIHPSRS